MDINNKDDLLNLLEFTYFISGDCPSDILGIERVDCIGTEHIEDCVICWRHALSDKIQLIQNRKLN